jgi:hypothetical protein
MLDVMLDFMLCEISTYILFHDFVLFITVHMLNKIKEIQLMQNVTVYLPNFVF